MTMGSDFHYENANLWFKNMDKLIAHVNARVRGPPAMSLLFAVIPPQPQLTPSMAFPASQWQPCPCPLFHPILLPVGAAPGQPLLVRLRG